MMRREEGTDMPSKSVHSASMRFRPSCSQLDRRIARVR